MGRPRLLWTKGVQQQAQGHPHLKQDPPLHRLQQRFWSPWSKQTAAFCIVWLVQHPIIPAPDMCLWAEIPLVSVKCHCGSAPSHFKQPAGSWKAPFVTCCDVKIVCVAHSSSVTNLWGGVFVQEYIPYAAFAFCGRISLLCLGTILPVFTRSAWKFCWFSQLTPAQFDPDVGLYFFGVLNFKYGWEVRLSGNIPDIPRNRPRILVFLFEEPSYLRREVRNTPKHTPETHLRSIPLRQTSRSGHIILRHTHVSLWCLFGMLGIQSGTYS